MRASQAGGRLENRGREPLSECGQDTAAPVGKFWREGTQGRAHGPVHRPEKGQLCPSAGTTRAWGRSPAAPLTGCVTPSWHLRDHLSVSRSPHFTAEEADVTCPGSPAGTRQSWDQNPVSRGSRWVHYGPSGSKVARKDLTASRSRGTLGLWGGDKGGAAGRLSGQRQDNGQGVGGGLPPLTVKNRSRTTTFYCPCAVSQSHRGTEVAPPREAGRPV